MPYKGSKVPLYVHLLSDLLLVSQEEPVEHPSETSKLTLLVRMILHGATCEATSSTSFKVVATNQTELCLEASSEKECTSWITSFQRCVENVQRNHDKTQLAKSQVQMRAKLDQIASEGFSRQHTRHTADECDLEYGVWDAQKRGHHNKIPLPPLQDGDMQLEVSLKRAGGTFFHTTSIRFRPLYFLQIRGEDLRDSHKYSHVQLIKINSDREMELTFVHYVPHGSWRIRTTDIQTLTQLFVGYGTMLSIKMNVEFKPGVATFDTINPDLIPTCPHNSRGMMLGRSRTVM